jgi:hypothetical protein
VNGVVVDAAAVPQTPTKRTKGEPGTAAKKHKGNPVGTKDVDGAAAEERELIDEGGNEDED